MVNLNDKFEGTYYMMDLGRERKDNKELVAIRSSSCVIKICETHSVFKSCHSGTSSVSQETRIFNDAKPAKRVEKNHIPRSTHRDSYSEEEDVVEQSPAHASGNTQSGRSQEEVERPSHLPTNFLKVIAPSVKDKVQAHSSQRMNDYDMLEILIQVLNELKSDCKNIFEKRESRDENAVKLIIRECFTQIMVRYSTDSSTSARGNSYNRCQKIISKSIKGLTLECVDIIERAICEQAKVMRSNREERENTKSLLMKLMQIIQTELNKSKPVLKVINTELHHPSFQFIFRFLKYFIEKSALGFKKVWQQSLKKFECHRTNRAKGAEKVSDSSCEISMSIGDQKLDEYASRLDRLLEKVSGEPPLQGNHQQLVIDCYHCTTKCKEQELLLKTVTRFTEEIKQELINHARVVNKGSHYNYIGNDKRKISREVSPCSPEMSTLESHTRGGCVQGDFCSEKSRSILPSKPVRNLVSQSRLLSTPADSCPRNQTVPAHHQSASYDNRQDTRSPGQAYSTQKHQQNFAHCSQRQRILINDVKLCTKHEKSHLNSRPTSPSCLHQHKTPDFECPAVSKSNSVPGGQKYNTRTSPHGGSATTEEFVEKCRYCTYNTARNKPCTYDALKIGDAAKTVDVHNSMQVYESGTSHVLDRLPKPPVFENSNLKAIPESHKNLDRKIVPKEEQGLVKKSKPVKDDQTKVDAKLKQDRNPKADGKSVKDDKPSDDRKKKVQSKDKRKYKSKTVDENTSFEHVTSKKGEQRKSKSPERAKQETKVSLSSQKESTSGNLKTLHPENEEKMLAPSHENESPKKMEPPTSEPVKELKQIPEKLEDKGLDENLSGASTMKTDQEINNTEAHCCRMNCNCRNRRGENQLKNSNFLPKRDSINQTDQEKHSSCCKGCNCDRNSIPVFMNGCMCKPGSPRDGELAMCPIYQLFANPVPVPCKCQETSQTKEQKRAQTSKPATPRSNRRDSQDTSTQTSKPQLSNAAAQSETSSSVPSSWAPTKSTPSSSAPSDYVGSTGPSCYPTSSSSEPTYLKSSTSHPTTSNSSHTGKSDSVVSCTCSMDKRSSQCIHIQTSKTNMKDACTSDTNCCCPEKIEEVFQEFDDKYSQVVKEIKVLIREGYIPLNKDETHELTTVTASRSSPEGTSTKTATCRCRRDSCKRCYGNPTAAFSRDPQSKPTHSKKERSNHNIDDECDDFQSGNYKFPKKQIKYDSRAYDACDEPPPPSQPAFKDTFIYNELQKDINDLKELVKNTRFGNCPCCKCCKCESGSHGKPCPPHEDAKNITKSAPGTNNSMICNDNKKQENVPNNQLEKKLEPSGGPPSEGNYFGTAPAKLNQTTVSRESKEEEPIEKPSPSKNEPIKKKDSIKAENRLEQSIPPHAANEDKENIARQDVSPDDSQAGSSKVGKRLSDGVQQHKSNSQDPAGEDPVSNTLAESDDKSQGPEQAREPTLTSLPYNTTNASPPGASNTAGSTSVADGSVSPITSMRRKSPENAIGSSSTAEAPKAEDIDDSAWKRTSPNGPNIVGSSILKESSKDKVGSKTISKKVEIDEPPSNPSSGTAGTSFRYPDDQASSETRENESGQVPHKTLSNVSFGSKKSALSSSSSKNMVLSPEQEALFQSRERLRDSSSRVQISPADGNQGTWRDFTERQYPEATEPGTSGGTPGDGQPGFFQRMFGGKTKTETTEKATPTDETVSTSDDSVGDSYSGESSVDICRTLLDISMEPMPCRFWSSETTSGCQGVDTYVMVLETDTSENDLATRDETFIISENTPRKVARKLPNENTKGKLEEHSELGFRSSRNFIQQTAFFASKSTNTIWKGIMSPIGIIKGLCKLTIGTGEPESTEPSTEMLEREFSKNIIQKPAKKLFSPLNVSSHYSHVRYKNPKNRDHTHRSAGDVRTYSSESLKKSNAKPRKTEDTEVQVTKWNAMTQTAGPRKFNRTDISKKMEDKLARYLGLERYSSSELLKV